MTMPLASDWRALAADLTGVVAMPGDETYETWRKPALERFHDTHPQAIARCHTTADVRAALSFARRFVLATAARSGGHDYAGRSSTSGMLLDLGAMNSVSVSGDIATVEPGALLGDLHRQLPTYGRAIPAGSCPTVGIGGLTLGGGLGFLGRLYGLTCDHLVGAEVVLPDGRVVECDDERDPELFWALRGAGAEGLGVVTRMTFKTVPLPTWTIFQAAWDYDDAANIMTAWQSWAPDAPDAFAASLLLQAPADPQQPPQVTLRGAATGYSAEATGDVFDGLVRRSGAQPRSWWRKETTWPESDPGKDEESDPGSSHVFTKSQYIPQDLALDTIGELVRLLNTDRRAGEARELDLSPWGGAYNRRPVDATAFPHRTARFLLKQAAQITAGHAGTQHPIPGPWLQRSWETTRPWGTGGAFPNFPDLDLNPAEAQRAYFGPNAERVAEIRAHYAS